METTKSRQEYGFLLVPFKFVLYSCFQAVVDHESWTMNLREANLYGYPIWFKLYSARQAYGMEALRPKDWDDLVERMTNDPKLFELFYK